MGDPVENNVADQQRREEPWSLFSGSAGRLRERSVYRYLKNIFWQENVYVNDDSC